MNVKRQLEALRDAAFQLALASDGVWHVESGVRGDLIRAQGRPDVQPPLPGPTDAFRRPLHEKAARAFMRILLCGEPKDQNTVVDAGRPYGFSFDAALAGTEATPEAEKVLAGTGHSFIHGDGSAMLKLARLVAQPAVRYLADQSERAWPWSNSWGDPLVALGDWVYIVYEIGLQTGDPNLRRYYRILSAFRAEELGGEDNIITTWDSRIVRQYEFGRPKVWDLVWQATRRGEIGYARLGTDLVVASRIALDHLADIDAKPVMDGFYAKWREHVARHLNQCEKFAIQAVYERKSEGKTTTAEDVAEAAGYGCDGAFKGTLASLRKRMLLDNDRGYFIPAHAAWVVEHLGLSQDHGQD